MVANAKITMNRGAACIACVSKFDIYLDGRKTAEIGQNGRQTFEVAPGKRRVEIRDWATNAPMARPTIVEVKDGENCVLNVVCMAKPSTYIFPWLALFSKKRRAYYFVQFEIQAANDE